MEYAIPGIALYAIHQLGVLQRFNIRQYDLECGKGSVMFINFERAS